MLWHSILAVKQLFEELKNLWYNISIKCEGVGEM